MCAFGSVHSNEHTVLWKYSQGTGVHGDETKKGRLDILIVAQNVRRKGKEHSLHLGSTPTISPATRWLCTRRSRWPAGLLVCLSAGFPPRVWARTRRECRCTVMQKEATKGNATSELDRTPGWAWVLRSPGASPDFWPASRPRRSDIPTGCKDKESSVASRTAPFRTPPWARTPANRRMCCRISGQFQRLSASLKGASAHLSGH